MDPITTLLYCEVNSLIKNNSVWNTIMMDKAFGKLIAESWLKLVLEGRQIYIQCKFTFQ